MSQLKGIQGLKIIICVDIGNQKEPYLIFEKSILNFNFFFKPFKTRPLLPWRCRTGSWGGAVRQAWRARTVATEALKIMTKSQFELQPHIHIKEKQKKFINTDSSAHYLSFVSICWGCAMSITMVAYFLFLMMTNIYECQKFAENINGR